jgi:glutamate synthase domain-containing protein 1
MAETGGRGAGARDLLGGGFERSNCGVGFVARLDGEARHEIVELGVRVLVNLEHRGAVEIGRAHV